MLTDFAGRIARLTFTPGNTAEISALQHLLDDTPLDASRLVADKAYASGDLFGRLEADGIEPVIPVTKNWNDPPPLDLDTYKARHLVENAFADLKRFRGIATRYCKLIATFTALTSLVAWYVNSSPTRRGPSPHLPTPDSRSEPTTKDAPPKQAKLWRREQG